VGEETMSLLEEFPEDNRDTVRDEGVAVLSRCVPPTAPRGRETGLVVGYVQSGKTMSFTTVSALAQDNRYQMIIVITGTSINLFKQSTERLQEDLRLPDLNRRWKHFANPKLRGTALRSIESALQRWGDRDVPEQDRQTVLITVMKNHTHLNNLIQLLSSLDLRNVPTLVIDDEADQAGLNTMVRQGAESTTYQRLLSLRSILPHHTFLQYTATPQAPLLINIIDALSPSFAEVLTPGQSYTGGRTFFDQQQQMNLIRIIPDAQIPTRDNILTEPPDTLLDAMMVFFLGVAAGMRLGGTPRNRSMMVHPSVRTLQHDDYFRWVQRTMQRWQDTLAEPETDPDRQDLVEEFRQAYDDLIRTVPDLPPFDDLLATLPRAIRETVPIEVNARRGRTPQVEWQQDYSHILVGGQSLDRGYTVEGLTITYMPRGRGVGNADTIQQRARWFGYKADYLGYCRVYIAAATAQAYRSYTEHEEDIRERLREHSLTGRPLRDWKRAFLLDTSLRPTRNNVLGLDYMQDVYSNKWFEPRAPHDSSDAVEENRMIVQQFISRYQFMPDEGDPRRQPHQIHSVASGIPLRDAYENLLTRLRTTRATDSTRFTGLQLQIERYLEARPNATCTVYQMSRGMTRDRSVSGDEIPNLFQGAYPDNRGKIYRGDRYARAEGELTIQIHNLRVLDENRQVIADNVPAVTVWVPSQMTADWLVQNQSGTE
jgi:hypothetical protein